MKIVAVANQKGGSGKTTTVSALAQAAAQDGKKVLAIDIDPQGNLSYSLGADANGPGSYALLNGEAAAEDLIQETECGPDIITANWGLQALVTKEGSAWRLAKAIKPLIGVYDFIFIDTPPTPGELQYNAMLAATDLVIPVPADMYGYQGLYQIYETAKRLQRSNPLLKLSGVILTRHSERSSLNKSVTSIICNKCQEVGLPVLGMIREAVAIREAAALHKPLYEYAPKSNPAMDYMAIYEKLKED